MARGRVDRRTSVKYESWDTLLGERGALSVQEGYLNRMIQRQDAEASAKCARYTEDIHLTQTNTLIFKASERLRSWCQCGSWALCVTCQTVHRQQMNMNIILRGESAHHNTVQNCVFCRSWYLVPKRDMFLTLLARLCGTQVNALRPLHLYKGKHHQDQGAIRRHDGLSKLKWSPVSIKTKIASLNI